MKINQVPQDQDPTYEGHQKLCYALDDKGKFVATKTSGWEVEEAVKDLAWQKINMDLAATQEQVRLGKASPLLYFMKLRLMDKALLANNMNISVWRLRWHLRPKVYAGLSERWLSRYADVLQIPVELLKTYDGSYVAKL